MRRVLLAFGPMLICAPLMLLADDTSSGADVQDVVYLAESRPVLLRLHVRIEGRPFREAWNSFVDSLFQYLDLDGNGVLNQEEIDRAPAPQLMVQLLRGGVLDPNALRTRRSPELNVNLIANKVTKQGLAEYYRLSGVEPLVAFIQDHSEQSDALTEAMFRHLDQNQDGKLSRAELEAAYPVLGKLDLNDDEMISRDEIAPSPDADPNGRPTARNKIEILTDSTPFLLLSADDSPTRLAYALIGRYDKDKDQKLSRKEIAFEPALFDKLDQDHDGLLDVSELSKLRRGLLPVDAELVVELGGPTGAPGWVFAQNPNSALVGSTRRLDSGALGVAFADAYLDVGTAAGNPDLLASARQFLLQQFHSSDVLMRGYLDPTQGDQNPFLKRHYASADRDGDGRLTEKELNAYLDLLGKAANCGTILLVTDHGRSLFELLSPHHDGRIRQRELRLAWQRLSFWDKDGDGCVSRAELPRQFELLLSQGQPGDILQTGDMPVPPQPINVRRSSSPLRGPLWFRNMDRNGDGFVSAREFLGSREDFKRIDTDGDGLISPEEAQRADEEFRRRKAP